MKLHEVVLKPRAKDYTNKERTLFNRAHIRMSILQMMWENGETVIRFYVREENVD